jgi:hypothetical protein
MLTLSAYHFDNSPGWNSEYPPLITAIDLQISLHHSLKAAFLGVGGKIPPCPALWIAMGQAVARRAACIEDGCIFSSPERPPAGGLSTLVKQNHTI